VKIACIIGIDGTGKSTLARGLTRALDKQGVPAATIYGKTYPILSRLFIVMGRVTVLRRHDQWIDYGSYVTTKKNVMHNRFLAGAYSVAVLLDYFPQMWLKLLPHLIAGRVVVCDRYLYDTVINDLAVHLNYSDQDADRAIKFGMKLLPNPMMTVLLDVPPEVAIARKNDVPHIDYLNERRYWYLRLKQRAEVRICNGEDPAGDLVNSLLVEVMAK